MSLYVFAFISPPASPLLLPEGIDRDVQLVCSEPIAAIVEPDISLEALEKTDEPLLQAVLAHDRVIRELFAQTTLLPLRFGSSFASATSLLTHLNKHQYQYLTTLSRLTDKVEYTVTFTPCSPPDESATANVRGKAYLLAKKQRYQQQQLFQAQQHEQWERVRPLVLEHYPNAVWGNSQGEAKQLYLLVQRQAKVLMTQHLPIWQAACSHWQVTLSEALPPYHFV